MQPQSEQVAKLTWQIDDRADRDAVDRAMRKVVDNGGEYLIHKNVYLNAKNSVEAKKSFEHEMIRGNPERAGEQLAEYLAATNRLGDPGALRAVPITAKLAQDDIATRKFLGGFERRLNSYYPEDESLTQRRGREMKNAETTQNLKQVIVRSVGRTLSAMEFTRKPELSGEEALRANARMRHARR